MANLKTGRTDYPAAEAMALPFTMAMAVSAHAPCLLMKDATTSPGMNTTSQDRKSMICGTHHVFMQLNEKACMVQGIVGSTPWNAMVFFTLWLQLLGFTDYSASVLMALFAGGCAVGSAVGGYLGQSPQVSEP